jgi:prepilin-type N-terminal cleavage/methylation domain-containing protein
VTRFAGQRGETLVEVLIAIVLIGVISSAYFVTASTQTRASSVNKELVQADAVARSYAELAKSAVRNGCTAGAPLTIDSSSFPSGYSATAPSSGPGAAICPDDTTPQQIDLTVTTPNNAAAHLSFSVLAP